MTFACLTLGFGSSLPGSITTPVVNIRSTSVSTGIRSGSFTLVNDGTLTKVNGSGASSYFTPTTSGIGSSLWVRFTISSSTNSTISGSATGTWISLSAGASWAFANTATNNEGTGSFALAFATDSGGSAIVGTGGGGWDVGFAP